MPVRCAVLLGIVLVLTAGRAASDDAEPSSARSLFREGIALSKDERWTEAHERLSRSLAAQRTAITLYSLGVVEVKLGRLVSALERFGEFLDAAQTESSQRYLEPARRAVEDLERRVARLVVEVTPADAPDLVVELDGAPMPASALGRERLLDPGPRELRVRARGFRGASRSLELDEGERLRLVIDLAEEGAADEPATSPAEDDFPVVPVVLMTVGGATFGAGLAVGLVGYAEARDVVDPDGPEADAAVAKAVAGDVVAGVGAVVAVVGLTLLFVEGDDDEPTAIGPRGLLFRF